ncbi:4-aminobutyrate--2-oxoglutarate transaminase [candidate division KSB1 bacterium]|nr:4-aminobutyrate--2-oxoglutarate transaminase [candidate division KSB1 bacterium]
MSFVKLQTPIPGPQSQALMQRRQAAVPRGPYNSTPVFVEKAEGALLMDVDGNTFIDFAGGIGTMNLGHCNARVAAAIAEQAHKFTHTCYHVTAYEPYIALAEKLNALTPGNFAKKTMLANSGVEAVENAIKIARYATGRSGVIAFEHAFHGRTLMGMSLTSKVKPYKYGFGPMASDIYRLPYPYEYRWRHDHRPIDWAAEYESLFAEFFASHVAADKIAALIIEPVLGEGGFVPAPAAALEKMAEICKRHGIVFIADEVQTGFCRTGKFFAIAWTSVAPDIVVMAKSIASGLPLSAITGRAELMDAPHEGGLGGTYGGNPIACQAALATLAEMERLNLNQFALEIGEYTRDYFHRLAVESPFIGEVRGIGAMNALELVQDKGSKVPYQDAAKRIQQHACQLGLISLTAGTYSNILRTLMPLSIPREQLAEGLAIMEKAILSLAP